MKPKIRPDKHSCSMSILIKNIKTRHFKFRKIKLWANMKSKISINEYTYMY